MMKRIGLTVAAALFATILVAPTTAYGQAPGECSTGFCGTPKENGGGGCGCGCGGSILINNTDLGETYSTSDDYDTDGFASLLAVLAGINPHPESVPINALVAVEGTPLEELAPVDPLEMVRMVAVARILMPYSRVRLSAGREALGREGQLLCLLAGADSIFYGDTLLTTANPGVTEDQELLAAAGVVPWDALVS